MNPLVHYCLQSANRAQHLALTATDDESRAYWRRSAQWWTLLSQLAVFAPAAAGVPS